jgi:hypothetical protein
MSEIPVSPPPPAAAPGFDLTPGLLEYYSSQAELMLSQYENINRLLGPTHDWTHPGDFCEILFRDFLRKFLPPSLSADKGFFYGRATIKGEDIHCPEIDILIHDTQQFRPLFRIGDFVIVQPQAVRGMIQVKRILTRSGRKSAGECCDRQAALSERTMERQPQGLGILAFASPGFRCHPRLR